MIRVLPFASPSSGPNRHSKLPSSAISSSRSSNAATRPRRTLGGVGPVHHLEGEVGSGAAHPRDDVRRTGREVGVEVDGVGVVQPLAGVLVRRVDQHRVLEVVVEGHLQRGADAAGEVVVALREVLLGDLERRVGDQLLRLGDGLA